MDLLESYLADAIFFRQEKNEKALYYKALDAFFEVLAILERFYVYELDPFKSRLTRDQLEDLLSTALDLMEIVERCLPSVCELTKEAAISYSRASTGLNRKAVVKEASSVSIHKINSVTRLNDAEEASAKSPIEQGGMEEPVSIKVPDEEVPLIPTSLLQLELYDVIFQTQLIMQRLAKYIEASPKARSNAAFLSGLRQLFVEFSELQRSKMNIEMNYRACQDKIDLLDCTPKEIAAQLTLLNARMVQLCPFDVLRLHEPDREFGRIIKDLNAFLNSVVQFEILGPRDHTKRIRALNHWVLVCLELSNMNSYNILKAISDGILSSNINRAKDLAGGLSTNREYELKKLKERLSIKDNYRVLRREIEKDEESHTACIPFLDPYLNDLRMNFSCKSVDSKEQRAKREEEIERIVDLLVDMKVRSRAFVETIEPDPVIQHWLLSRPFKNSQELDNLAVSRSETGGRYTPDQELIRGPPDVFDFGDEGYIRFNAIQSKLLENR